MNPETLHLPVRVQSRQSATGFTLVELLVTIVVIAALAALAFTMTGKIRTKAQQANATTALRQVAGASVAYSIENNGDINTMRWAGDSKEGGGGKWVINTFWGRMEPYLFTDAAVPNQQNLKKELGRRLDSLFNSPDSDTMAGTFLSGAKIYHDTSGLPVPLAFNRNLYQWNNFVKTSTLGDPARVLYATYGFDFFNEEHGKKYAPIPLNNSVPSNKIYYTDSRQAITSFLDGHVEMLSPPISQRLYK